MKLMKSLRTAKNVISGKRPIAELVEKFKEAFEQAKKSAIGRDREIDMVMRALLCKEHILLDGPPGVAKSLIARHVFDLFTVDDEAEDEPIVVYKKTFMKGTNLDEVFGPMDARLYREKAIWRHNTHKMLPKANFAFLDELYRASDTVLESMMAPLNERIWNNGEEEVKCPLITAIATTNFISDNAEMAAFVDRWLFSIRVDPLPSVELRMQAVELSMQIDRDNAPEQDERTLITLGELSRLQDAVRNVTADESIFEAYVSLVDSFKANCAADGEYYVSDRRMCRAIKLAQVSALLEGRKHIEPDDLLDTGVALIQTGNKKHQGYFDAAFKAVVSNAQKLSSEKDKLKEMEGLYNKARSKYDESMSLEKKKKLLVAVNEIASEVTANNVDFETPLCQGRYGNLCSAVQELQEQLKNDILEQENV